MAITALNDYGIANVNFNTMMETLDKTFKGKAEITLSDYDTDAAPDVKVGSVFENNGALFIVDTADITPTGYAGISSSTTFYLYYDESGTAFIYSETVPTWNDALQGFYNGNDRAFFSMFKDSGDTLYQLKTVLRNPNVMENMTIGNGLTINGLVKWKHYYKAGSQTENDLYDALISWIPSDGDFLACHGQIINNQITANGGTITGIRNDTRVLIRYTTDSGSTFVICADGDATAACSSIEIMSNFDFIT